MNHSQQPDSSHICGNASADDNVIPLETDISGDVGHPVSETKREPTDVSTDQGVPFNCPAPDVLQHVGDVGHPVSETKKEPTDKSTAQVAISNCPTPEEPQDIGDRGHPMSEQKRGPTDKSIARVGSSHFPTPGAPQNTPDDRPTLRGTAKHRSCGHNLISWLPEYFCCLLSILSVIVVIIILRLVDGHAPTDIMPHVTVNSLIQFLISIAKFALMVPIVSVSGQLKWLWFKDDPHPLIDFELQDGAGLGGLKSMKFSLKLRMIFKWPIAWIAAVVALSGFFTSPISQQLIGYVSDRQTLGNGTASVLRATTFSRSGATGFKPIRGEDLLVQTAYLTAAYLGPNQKLPGVDPICSSGDCDWPIYGSLGICAEIVNLSASTNSSLLPWLHEVFIYELRDSRYSAAISVAGSGPYYLAALVPLPEPSTEFKKAPPQTVISQAFVGYVDNPVNLSSDSDLEKMQYIGVSLYFCTQSFSTTVKGGIPSTSELGNVSDVLSSSTTELINSYWNEAIFDVPLCNPGPLTGSTIALSGATGLSNESYRIDFCTGVYLSELYIVGTSGAILITPEFEVDDTVGQISQALGIAIYGDFPSPIIPDRATKYGNIELMMENIAKSLTSYMRNTGPTFPDQHNSTITGTAYAPQIVIKVRWPYISYIAVQLGLAIIVLFFTIIATYQSRVQILKADSFATLCGLSQGVKIKMRGIEDLDESKESAKEIWVKLEPGADGMVKSLDKATPVPAS